MIALGAPRALFLQNCRSTLQSGEQVFDGRDSAGLAAFGQVYQQPKAVALLSDDPAVLLQLVIDAEDPVNPYRVGGSATGFSRRLAASLGGSEWSYRRAAFSALPPDADPQQLAMLGINPPTAALLLSEYVDLKPGEWVVQNAANSGVGRWVIAFAKTRGLKTVSIVRRPELVAELEALGGDVVVVDSPDVPERINAAVGQAELRLALDGVSGPATGVLAATLSPRATLVSFAAMSEGLMSINPLDVIFKPLTMRGFWLGHPEIAAKIAPAIAPAAAMIASGRVRIPVAATYPLSSIKEAVAHVQRGGKILLDVAGSRLTSESR
jgi:NADPH:quinone reductase-like Zn-dependent oxidoreductase